MKPRILISGTAGRMDNYVRAVSDAEGDTAAVYAPAEFESYDGLILAGGEDIAPGLYGQVNEGLSVGMDPVREASDRMALDAFVKAGKPVLGICRGMQMLAVLFGGDMIQDLGEGCKTHTGEGGVDKFHTVRAGKGTLLNTLYGDEFETNSSHHQAVKTVSEDFAVTAYAQDGTIEAIEHKSLDIVGVQWHPERYDGGAKLIEWFVEKCKK